MKRSSERTSYAVRKKWDREHLKTISYQLPIDLVDSFREKCAETNTPQAQVIRKAIQDFLDSTQDTV